MQSILECGSCGHDISGQCGQIECDCPKCGAVLNGFGQVIEYPQGRGEEFAGESYWEEEA